MKSKLNLVLLIVFLFNFFVAFNLVAVTNIDSTSFQDRIVSIDLSSISNNINNGKYVLSLKNSGISIIASENDDNCVSLNYAGVTLDYRYNSDTSIYTASFPIDDEEIYYKSNILNAIFIDCISTMQGNVEGSQICFAFDDSFDYFTLNNDGISKSYYIENDHTRVSYDINPFFKMSIPLENESITKSVISDNLQMFSSNTENCIIKHKNILLYKTVSDTGNYVIYVGNPNTLSNFSYSSLLTAFDTLFNDKRISYYLKQNYSSFDNGNLKIDGISIETGLTELPISNIDTILMPSNMVYAKITVNKKDIAPVLETIQLPDSAKIGDATHNSNTSTLKSFIIIVIGIILFFGIIFGIKKFKHKEVKNP